MKTLLSKPMSTMSGAALGFALLAVSLQAQPTGQWDFDSGNLTGTVGAALQYADGAGGATQLATQFGSTTALGIPNIGGAPAQVMRFSTNGAGFLMPTPAAGNGGGGLVNDYTIVFDILFPAASNGKARALVDADGGLINVDAEFFVNADNGIGAKGQSVGTILPDTWHRIGFVVDGTALVIRAYIDGNEVGSRKVANLIDDRFALAPASTAALFSDDNGERAVGYVNSIQLRNVALTKPQMRALAGPTAAGIPATLPPVPSAIEQWIPRGAFASRTTAVGAIIAPGDTTIQDSSITLTLDNQALASPTVTRAGGLITVQKDAGALAIGEHTMILRYTDSLAGARSLTNKFTAALFYEDFEGLTLGPRFDENNAATEAFQQAWTNRPPAGWSIDNSKFAAVVITPDNPDSDGDGYADLDGRTEWAGWSFANKDFWIAADNQTRDQFSLGQGTLAIADNDEWDDQTHLKGFFNSFLKTPLISLAGIAPNTAFLGFASSWRPEALDDGTADPDNTITTGFPAGPNGEKTNNQTAIITVSYNGGAGTQVMKWDSIQGSPTFHPDKQNESVLIALNNPASATNMVITFAMVEAANDWWWAIDNIVVNAGASPPIITKQPTGAEVNESQAAELTVAATGSGLTYQWMKGQGTNKVPLAGATSASLSLASARVEDSGYYSVDVKNSVGTVSSIGAKISVLPTTSGRLLLLEENFDKLPLGPNVDEAKAGTQVWTKTAPQGWSIDDTGVPGAGTDQDGVTEWAGWSFADNDWWASVDDQQRSAFLKAVGAAAIADSDEFDDQTHPAGSYATYLKTKTISLQGVKQGSVILKFDSSWRPEDNQKANVTVAFDGGAAVEVLRFESPPASPNFHPDETSETVAVRINNPANAREMTVTFGYFDASNNWWWAIDNIVVLGESSAALKITDGLAAYLPFDGDLKDASGNGVNGTSVGTTSFGQGKVGSGAVVVSSKKDGTSFNYVTLGMPDALKFGTNTDLTVSFWAKMDTWTADPSFVANKDWNSGGNIGFVIATDNDGRLQWNYHVTGTAPRKDYDGPAGTFTDKNWHHVVVSYARGAGSAKAYVDGKLVNTTDITPNTGTIDSGLPINIGQDGKGTYTDGGAVGNDNTMIDDVAIWRRALSDADVQVVFNKGSAGTSFAAPSITDDLAAHLKFDGDLKDASSNGVNGTSVGTTSFGQGKVGSGALVVSSKKDGTSFNYVTLGMPGALQFGTNTDLTVSFWGKMDTWTADPSFVANKDWNSGGNIGFVIATDNDGRLQWNYRVTGTAPRKDYDGPAGTFTDKNWHHVVVSYARGAGSAKAYVDGKLVNTTDITPNTGTIDSGLPINIGQDGKGTYTDGGAVGNDNTMIDDVAIWRRALTEAEVQTIFSSGATGSSFDGTGGGAPKLGIARSGTGLSISWTGAAVLESADSVVGPWAAVSNATSPFAVQPAGGLKFYRLKP
jgi:hypothetical protein